MGKMGTKRGSIVMAGFGLIEDSYNPKTRNALGVVSFENIFEFNVNYRPELFQIRTQLLTM